MIIPVAPLLPRRRFFLLRSIFELPQFSQGLVDEGIYVRDPVVSRNQPFAVALLDFPTLFHGLNEDEDATGTRRCREIVALG